MGVWRYEGDYFYGPTYKEKYERRDLEIGLHTMIKEKAFRHGFKKLTPIIKDPEGEELPYEWYKSVPLRFIEDLETPKNYPGMYYWVWYNGAFFEVYGETEKYIRVWVGEGRYDQADALGIDRKKVESQRFEDQDVPYWWFRKSDVKMPDEFGRGKYIYLNLGGYYRPGVYEVVRRKGKYIRVRGRELYGDVRETYLEIKKKIEENAFPEPRSGCCAEEGLVKMRNEIDDIADPEVWMPTDNEVLYEVTFDLEKLRKYRMKRKNKYQTPYLDFYLYGEEEVPYRL